MLSLQRFMSDIDYLAERFPELGRRLGRVRLAELPTPVRTQRVLLADRERTVLVKHDNLTSAVYGGNKVRKLEYLLAPVGRKPARRLATFGTVGSHHALATALFARDAGYECTCFLAHQRKTAAVPATLNLLLHSGTEIVRYGGAYAERVRILRQHLWNRNARVVPAGGSSWYGTLGFVNAGLELAAQIEAGEIPAPNLLYVATGTMGTAAGLALGLALAGLPTEIQAIRVSHTAIANEDVLHRLIAKTVLMMNRLDACVPRDLAQHVNIRLRHDFFAGGYAHSNEETEAALKFARRHLNLHLESTYTGKAMAAILSDLGTSAAKSGPVLFWNTYNSAPLELSADAPADSASLPQEFLRYFT